MWPVASACLWVASHLLTFQVQGPSISVPWTQVPAAISLIHFKSHSKSCVSTSHFFTFASFLLFFHLPLQIVLRYSLFDISQHKAGLNFMAFLQPFWMLTALVGFPYDSMCSQRNLLMLWSIFRSNRQNQSLYFLTKKQCLWLWLSTWIDHYN